LLREDNADLRLREVGYEVGLVSHGVYEKFKEKREGIERLLGLLSEVRLTPKEEVNLTLEGLGLGPINQPATLMDFLKRPGIGLEKLARLESRILSFDKDVAEQATILVKYDGYIRRQTEQVERTRHLEGTQIPDDFDYKTIPGLSNEVKEKFLRVRPISIGQASRISGITPAAISIVQIYLKKWAAS
jgi:tRNA uridine 5-carboxymethylaminomethyl modification enzyme